MLKRFPVESKGRRKKLHEVYKYISIYFFILNFTCASTCVVIFKIFVHAGRKRYNNLLRVFPCKMYHGKVPRLLFLILKLSMFISTHF